MNYQKTLKDGMCDTSIYKAAREVCSKHFKQIVHTSAQMPLLPRLRYALAMLAT